MPAPTQGTGKDAGLAEQNAREAAENWIAGEIRNGNLNNPWNYYSITMEAPDRKPGATSYVCGLTIRAQATTVGGGLDHPKASNKAPNNTNKKGIQEMGQLTSGGSGQQPDPPRVDLKCDEFVYAASQQASKGATESAAIEAAFKEAMWQALGKHCPHQCGDVHIHIWTHYQARQGSHRAKWWVKVWCGEEADESN